MPTQKKHIYRVHYTLGYRQLTFAKSLAEKPFYDLIIYDSNAKNDYDLNVQLANEGNISTSIYYNVWKDIFEAEIRVKDQLTTEKNVEDIVEAYKVCGWKCETIKQDIEDLKSFLNKDL